MRHRLFAADRIRIPLLIALGANDARVKQSEAEQIVAAIEKSGGTATYVLYSDEGHGITRPANTDGLPGARGKIPRGASRRTVRADGRRAN